MHVTVYPQLYGVAVHKLREVVAIGGHEGRVWTGPPTREQRRVVCNDYGGAAERASELRLQPCPGSAIDVSQVARIEQPPSIGDLLIVVHAFAQPVHDIWVFAEEIGPQRGAQKAHAADFNAVTLKKMYQAAGHRRADFTLHLRDIAAVILVISSHVDGGFATGFEPCNPCRADVYVAGSDDHVGVGVGQGGVPEFQMDVGKKLNFHRLNFGGTSTGPRQSRRREASGQSLGARRMN